MKKKQGKNINIIEDEETRLVMSNPISKGVDSSIAMGIDTTYSPLPLKFNTKSENDK
jgi:hypothetical protein